MIRKIYHIEQVCGLIDLDGITDSWAVIDDTNQFVDSFPTQQEAIKKLIEMTSESAALGERSAIVSWLRSDWPNVAWGEAVGGSEYTIASYEIEDGKHWLQVSPSNAASSAGSSVDSKVSQQGAEQSHTTDDAVKLQHALTLLSQAASMLQYPHMRSIAERDKLLEEINDLFASV